MFKNIAELEKAPPRALSEWLEVGIRELARVGMGRAFSPLDDFIRQAGGVGEGLELATNHMGPAFRVKLRRALKLQAGIWPPTDRVAWTVILELTWRLGAVEVAEVLLRRCSERFLNQLLGEDKRAFITFIHYLRGLPPGDGRTLSDLIGRLVSMPSFPDSQARLTLAKLCEIDPDGWVDHFRRSRTHLHRQMTRINETSSYEQMLAFQDELAEDLLDLIGFDRFADDCNKLRIMVDPPNATPTDNWFTKSLVERVKLIEVGDDGRLFPRGMPGNVRAVEDELLLSVPMPECYPSDLPARERADLAFGQNAIAYRQEAA